MSGRAVEAAGDVDTLLLDKTGTITLGNRQAVEIITAAGIEPARRGAHRLSLLACRRDAGRPLDRRAGSTGRRAQRRSAAGLDLRAVQRLHAHERPRPRRRHEDSQRRARLGARVGPRAGRQSIGRALAARSSASRAAAARPLLLARNTLGRRRDLSQRHSQAEHDASASTGCGRWAFAR